MALNDSCQRASKKKHDFVPSRDVARHVRLSACDFRRRLWRRSFPANGLVITNHHVAADTLQKLLHAEKELIEHGYLARTRKGRAEGPDLELNVLRVDSRT